MRVLPRGLATPAAIFLLDGRHERVAARRRGGIADQRGPVAGKCQLVHLRRVGRRIFPVHLHHRARRNHLQSRLRQGIDEGMLAEPAHGHVRAGSGRCIVHVPHCVRDDIDAPTLQYRFKAGRLCDGGVIEQNKQPSALREIIVNLLQFQWGERLRSARR